MRKGLRIRTEVRTEYIKPIVFLVSVMGILVWVVVDNGISKFDAEIAKCNV